MRMNKKTASHFIFGLGLLLSVAPVARADSKNLLHLSFAAATPNGNFRFQPSVMWVKPVYVNHGFNFGLGIRFSTSVARDTVFKSNEDAFYQDPVEVALDPTLSSLNLAFAGHYQLFSWLGVGMNLDLVGASAGARINSTVAVKPNTLNLVMGGRPDKGSLVSEFFFTLPVTGGSRIKVGYNHSVLGYRVTQEVAGTPKTYQRFIDLLFLGYVFPI